MRHPVMRYRPPRRWRPVAMPAFAPVAVALATALLTGCSPGGEEADPGAAALESRRPHILLLALDTVRADAVGPYRRGRPSVTPHLDAFAEDAVIFERAVVPMAFTLPSHMSMLTGLHPLEHRVTTEKERLPAGIETLADWLRPLGYRTVGLVTNDWLKGEFGFSRGFDSYQRLPHGLTYAPRVNDAGLEALDGALTDGRPLFLFLHYMDAHSDFASSRGNRLPYYAPDERLGELARGHRDRRYCDEQDRCATAYLTAADREERELPAERLDELHGLYEAGIAELDARLGELFAALRERGVYDDALIVVVSDHGEEFREHGKLLHSQNYEESLRVPLMIKLPGNRRAGERIGGLASVTDLPPTLVARLGSAAAGGAPPPYDPNGQIAAPIDLLAPPGEGTPGRRRALAQDKLVRSRWSLTQGRFKLIRDLKDGSDELFDLRGDPGELHDLAADRPRVAEGLGRRLERELRDKRRRGRELASRPVPGAAEPETEASEPADGPLTAEERERLRALGYL